MRISELVRENKILAILLIAGVIQVSVEVVSNGFTSFPDTKDYIETVKWYQDGSGEALPLRIQRPLQILIVLAFEPLMGITASFALTNSIFYLGSIPFFYSFSRKLLHEERLAAYSTFMFMTSFCVLYYGLAVLTDMLMWFLFCVCLDLLIDIRGEWQRKKVYAFSIVVGLGMLNKEIFAVLGLLLTIVYLSHHSRFILNGLKKAAEIALPMAVMAAPFLLVQYLMLRYFGSGSTFFAYHLVHVTGDIRGSLLYLVATFVIAFNAMLVFYSVGLRRFLTENAIFTKREYVVWLAVLLLPVLFFEQYSPRLSFITFGMVIPPSVLGMVTIAKRLSKTRHDTLACFFLVVYAIVSNVVALFGDEVRELVGIWPKITSCFF